MDESTVSFGPLNQSAAQQLVHRWSPSRLNPDCTLLVMTLA